MTKIRFRAWIIHKLVKLIYWFGGFVALEPLVFFRPVYIKINELEEYEKITRKNCSNFKWYKWDLLRDSIKKHGLKRPLSVYYNYYSTGNKLYELVDGHHRVALLRELYGDDHRLKVNLYVPDPFDAYDKYRLKNKYGNQMSNEELNDVTYKVKKQFNSEG
tara:strand:- start:836 stop:1318 length:483 start_codon:yes stop_codon:yes gene_type:complete